MRQTLLNFRSPSETTPEFRLTTVTYKGTNLNYEPRDDPHPPKVAAPLLASNELPQDRKDEEATSPVKGLLRGNMRSNFGKE